MSFADYRIGRFSTNESNALSNAALASDVRHALLNNSLFENALKIEEKAALRSGSQPADPLTTGFSFLPSDTTLPKSALKTESLPAQRFS
jgi:hypothetical protein